MNRRQFLTLAAFAALPAPRRLVAFGDSITAGAGASSPDRAFAALVASALGRSLDNYAVGGSRIAEQVETIKATTFLPGDVALWLTGYNDMRGGTSLDEYRAALRLALSLFPCPLIVAGCLPMTEAGYRAYGPRWSHGSDEAAAAYREALRALVPTCRSVAGYDPCNVVADGVHPNDLGHAQIAAGMVAAVWVPHIEK